MTAPISTRFGTSLRQLGFSAALALFALSVLPSRAGTMTFTATDDNTILNAEFADTNLGANNPISSGTVSARDQRAFLRFDVSSLDGLYSSIDSITLRLYYFDDSSANTGNAEVTTDVHPITAANRAWAEGTATWNNQSTGTPWAGSAGLSTAGTDYDSTVLASSTIDLSTTSSRPAVGAPINFTFTGTSAALTALIDSWMVDNVDNSRDNPGLLLRDPSPTFNSLRNRLTVSSIEDANAGLHPQLIVEYSTSSDFSVVITPTTGTPGHYDFEWNSRPGKLYDLLTSSNLATPTTEWPVHDNGGSPYEAIPSAGETTTLAAVPSADPRRFFAVRETDAPPPPPLLSEDFETGDGGFTVATIEGTAWERGAPDSSGPGGTVSAGNDGSANAWGTNLGTFSSAGGAPTDAEKGIYINPTTTALRTPVLDLTAAAGAALTFAEAKDFPATDTAVVNLINATTDDIIAQVHVSLDPNIDNDASWANVGPIDLAPGLGQQVRIEWRFTGTGGSSTDFLGWYIDDVVVAPN